MASKQIVLVVGVGPGVGQACAEMFAQKGHPVALLSRNMERLKKISDSINEGVKDPKRTRPYSVDVTKKVEVEKAFESIKKDFGKDFKIHTTIFNTGGLFKIKSFLDLTEEEYRSSYETQCIGAVHIAQAFIQSLKQTEEWNLWEKGENQNQNNNESVGNLLFSGATAAMRGSAKMSSFACSSFALRALFQSIAREFGPNGLHCSHFIIDGLIDTETTRKFFGNQFDHRTRLDPKEIAQLYYDTTLQKPSVWSYEVDLRPAKEKW